MKPLAVTAIVGATITEQGGAINIGCRLEGRDAILRFTTAELLSALARAEVSRGPMAGIVGGQAYTAVISSAKFDPEDDDVVLQLIADGGVRQAWSMNVDQAHALERQIMKARQDRQRELDSEDDTR